MKRVLFLLLLSPFINILAKDDFRKGIIITMQNDTIQCEINYNISNYKKCYCKTNDSSQQFFYEPFQIKAFRYIDGKYFVSKKLKVRNSYIKNQDISYTTGLGERHVTRSWYTSEGYKVDSVFAEYLIDGPLKIYYYLENSNEHYFAELEGDTIYDLTNEKLISFENGVVFDTKKVETFKNKLLYAMRDCPGLSNSINNSKLNHSGLIKLAKKYYECTCENSSCLRYCQEIKNTKVKVEISLGTGWSNSKRFYISNGYEIFVPTFIDIGFFNAGINLNFYNYIKSKENIILTIGGSFSNHNYINNYTTKNFANSNDTNVSRKYSCINWIMNEKVTYNFFSTKNTPFVSFGFSQLYSVNINYADEYNSFGNFSRIFESGNRFPFYKFGFGSSLSLGYHYNYSGKNRINFQLETSQYFNSNLMNIIFLIGYEF